MMKIIGLDVGEKRIGVARADTGTRIAVPVGFINVDGLEFQEIAQVAKINKTNFFVLGWPRSNEGNETQQSLYVKDFARALSEEIPEAKIRFQDESLTSVVAEERLKAKKKKYTKGDIDAEAAAIILQDFMESFAAESLAAQQGIAPSTEEPEGETDQNTEPNTKKEKHKMKKLTKWIILSVVLVLVATIVGGGLWAKAMLEPVDGGCAEGECKEVEFTVSEGESRAEIAENLAAAGLIKNSLVFTGYSMIFKSDAGFKGGQYVLNTGQSVDDIIAALERGPVSVDVFTFTVRPGETIYDVRDNLIAEGYSVTEVEQALAAKYDFKCLQGRPEDATLEGYLFGETHEFYVNTPAKEIIETFLKGMDDVITENNLETRYAEQGLTLYEGITLASVVQKEAKTEDFPTVAQVFLSRLGYGMLLGSDVTVSYALDKADPGRQAYSDNTEALTVDSCYNTRLYAGLPCGPISNPGLAALLAVAEPSDTAYLYFLTGDDGLMYYSYTEDEHLRKVYTYCQNLCSVSL